MVVESGRQDAAQRGDGRTGRPLGARQLLVLAELERRGGLRDGDAGALIHSERGQHGIGQRCEWCGRDGRQVLASLRSRGLLVRRRLGVWELRDKPRPPAPEPDWKGF